MRQSSFIKINPADSVVVCLCPMKKGETIEVDGKSITLLQDTPAGHKVLIDDAPEGKDIIKYGYPIGHAKKDLKQGEWSTRITSRPTLPALWNILTIL